MVISLSRRASIVTAAILVSSVGAGLAALAPPAQAATAPTVTAGTALGQGAVDWPLTITGTGLTAATTVTFTKTGTALGAGAADTDIVVDTKVPAKLTSSTSLTVYVNVAAAATTGQLDIVVTNSAGSGTCYPGAGLASLGGDPGCLALDAAPGAPTFSSSVGVGAFAFQDTVTTKGLVAPASLISNDTPAAISQASITVTSATQGTASITVPATTGNGAKTVTLINGDGGRNTGTLTITAPPTLSSVSPATGDAGQQLTITGTSKNSTFETAGSPAVLFLGQKYVPTALTTSSFTATITIPAGTPGGATPVTFVNGDGGTDTERGVFSVIGAPGAPPSVMVDNVASGTATVLWQDVSTANNGGAPIVSYNVTTTPDTGNHPVIASALPSFTLTGLTDGTTYTATVTATNSDSSSGKTVMQTGPGTTSAAFTLPAPAGTGVGTLPGQTPTVLPVVTLKASKSTVNFASPVTISGKATLSGAPLANTVITLQTIGAKGARTSTGETTTTKSDGSFSFKTIYPAFTSTYGIGVGANTATANVKVTVTQYLLISKSTLSTARSYVLTGLGTPGTADKKDSVVLFKVTKTGHRVGTITKTTLAKTKKAKGYSAGVSDFTLKATLKRGTYLVAVAILGTTTNGPVQSKPFTIKVP